MNNPSTDNRVAKLGVMAQNATQERKNEEALNNDCVGQIKQSYNRFANEMNTNMQFYMRAQKQIEEAMQGLMRLNKD